MLAACPLLLLLVCVSVRLREGSQFENNYCIEMCSGSESGSYLRRIDCVYHSTLGLRVLKKKKLAACPLLLLVVCVSVRLHEGWGLRVEG